VVLPNTIPGTVRGREGKSTPAVGHAELGLVEALVAMVRENVEWWCLGFHLRNPKAQALNPGT